MNKVKKFIMIGHIAKTELQTLFYSPIAWLVLVIIAIQTGMTFTDNFGSIVESQASGYSNTGISLRLFGPQGLLFMLQNNLYLYIPLLTMGLISRELSSGSIKLLYSAPVNNAQIVLGKYLAMMIFGLTIISIPLIYIIFCNFTVEHFELGAVLAGLTGIYLLICTYSAIGLFMSSISSYQIIAVICTVTTLGVLQVAGTMWQDMEFVQDITYWLSISNRTTELFRGLICSEDILYFIIVSSLFLSLTIARLRVIRQKIAWPVAWSRYIGIFALAMLLGFLTTRPYLMSFHDATHQKSNTLTPASQKILSKLDGGLTITAYNNILDRNYYLTLPKARTFDKYRFRQYWRFKPEIKFQYIHYYDKVDNIALEQQYPGLSDREKMIKMAKYSQIDTSLFLCPEEIRKIIDLSHEGNRFLRVLERENGKKAILRTFDDNHSIPTENEISAALQRLVMETPIIGFFQGHETRDYTDPSERGYSRFSGDIQNRHALINNGFDITGVQLDKEVPDSIDILVIADVRTSLESSEMVHLNNYIAKGGNLVIAGDVNRQEYMNPITESLGVTFLAGQLVKPSRYSTADVIISQAGPEAHLLSAPYFYTGMQIVMPGCTALAYSSKKGYRVTPLFTCDSSWNKLEPSNFIDDTIRLNTTIGETIQNHVTALALSRRVNNKEQKIVILGDADCISNGEIGRWRANLPTRNHSLVGGIFHWMSDGQAPLDVCRPLSQDNKVFLDADELPLIKIVFQWIIPGLLFLMGLFIWIRRRGK